MPVQTFAPMTKDFATDNARHLYKIQPPTTIIRERVCQIVRPDWWPTTEEIKEALKPEAALVR